MAAVHLTRIYTRTGDGGTTAIGDGTRVGKTDLRIVAAADVDECNAALGVALALGDLSGEVRSRRSEIQTELCDGGAAVGNPIVSEPSYPPLRITEAYVTRLE